MSPKQKGDGSVHFWCEGRPMLQAPEFISRSIAGGLAAQFGAVRMC